jgi:hypothetical protein
VLHRPAAALAALIAATVTAAPPLAAQYASVGAWIYDRTDDFGSTSQKFRLSCGTGLAPSAAGEILLASVPGVDASFACTGAEAFADATGGALRFRTRVTGPGAIQPPFGPPYAPGAGSRIGRVAQAAVWFGDVLTFAEPFTGTVRFEYELTGERRETPGTPPAGAGPTTMATGANVSLWWGDEPTESVSYSAPPGISDLHGHFDVPVVGSTLGYSLNLGGFARLTAPVAGPTFALVGEAVSDFAHTLRITRLAVLDQAGADVTAGTSFSSRVYTLGANGVVTGGQVLATPEPATVALVGAGLVVVAGARRRRNG